MSLGTKIVQSVQKETVMQRPLPLQATAEEGGVTASITLADNDRFSHMANEVKVESAKSKVKSPQAAAEKFAASATYLTESLQFVECQSDGTAVARSTPQTMRGKREAYYEASVGKSEISLQRYQPHPDKPGREAIPFCLTDEVLGRLVDDAASVLSPRK